MQAEAGGGVCEIHCSATWWSHRAQHHGMAVTCTFQNSQCLIIVCKRLKRPNLICFSSVTWVNGASERTHRLTWIEWSRQLFLRSLAPCKKKNIYIYIIKGKHAPCAITQRWFKPAVKYDYIWKRYFYSLNIKEMLHAVDKNPAELQHENARGSFSKILITTRPLKTCVFFSFDFLLLFWSTLWQW